MMLLKASDPGLAGPELTPLTSVPSVPPLQGEWWHGD